MSRYRNNPLLCVGGACDGQREANPHDEATFVKLKKERTRLVKYDPKKSFAEEMRETAHYKKKSYHYGHDEIFIWVHETLSPMDALMKLIQGYKP